MTPHEADRLAREEAATRLGVTRTATPDEVRSAHRRWALELRAGALDAEASERFRQLTEARDLLLAPPPPVPQRPLVLGVTLAGPITWQGGDLPVQLPDGRIGLITVPPAVARGERLPVVGCGHVSSAWAVVERIDSSPWRRGPDDRFLGPLDLGGRLEVSLYDVVVGAQVPVDTPWGRVEVTLPAGSLAPIRLRGKGLQPTGRPAGALVLELQVVWPPADDPLVQLALKGHRRPPRLL